MSDISPEVKEAAAKAYDNHTDYYTTEATGNTYPIKDKLQSWAFFWNPEKRAWINECTSEFEKFLFERHVIDGDWPGVKLSFIHNHLDKWEKEIGGQNETI
jgi:hypothetical protein